MTLRHATAIATATALAAALVTFGVLSLHVPAPDHAAALRESRSELEALEARTAELERRIDSTRSELVRRQQPMSWAANGGR